MLTKMVAQGRNIAETPQFDCGSSRHAAKDSSATCGMVVRVERWRDAVAAAIRDRRQRVWQSFALVLLDGKRHAHVAGSRLAMEWRDAAAKRVAQIWR